MASADVGVDNSNLMEQAGYDVPSWRSASIESRMEAVIVHEMVEVNHPSDDIDVRHADAIMNAPEAAANFAISEEALQILHEQRASWLAQRGGSTDGSLVDDGAS
jgi:hypothetical protein